MSDIQLAAHFFVQLAIILVACRIVGWLAIKAGQSQVIGEMIAGVFLGPSLLGIVAPSVFIWLFPQVIAPGGDLQSGDHNPSMSVLFVMSQLGLVLYMFLVGLELDRDLLKTRKHDALLVSIFGIVAPFLMGGALALLLHSWGGFFAAGVSPMLAVVFLGAAIAITAFPMLARIIQECGIAQTSLGTLALTAAAANDLVAWCLLSIVIAITDASPEIALIAILGGGLFVLAAIYIGRNILKFFNEWMLRKGEVTSTILVAVVVLVLLCGYLTDFLGIHSVFGAFMLGVIMPRGRFAEDLQKKLGPITNSVFLPIFFVYSGFNTRIGLLDSVTLWAVTGLIILAAIVGKGAACAIAARIAGEPWRESVMIGALMNARGLVELIILNIGLQRGVITPTLFTIMVLMAITTTIMVLPIFSFLYGRRTKDVALAES